MESSRESWFYRDSRSETLDGFCAKLLWQRERERKRERKLFQYQVLENQSNNKKIRLREPTQDLLMKILVIG